MLQAYRQHLMACEKNGTQPQPLSAEQTLGLIELLQNPPPFEEAVLVDLLVNQVTRDPEAIQLKTAYLQAIIDAEIHCPIIGRKRASELLSV